MKKPIYACFLMLYFLLVSSNLFSAALPTGFTESRLASGLDPTGVTAMSDGRVLITIKSGRIRIIKNGVLLSNPMITIPNVDNWNERGLLTVIEDPGFASNGFIYVYYTYKNPSSGVSNNRVSRFTVNGDVASPGSELVLINFDNLSSVGWHNGGGLVYGADGKIYASTGENTVGSKAQSFTSLLGKVLRINPDGSIPTDNPYYSTTSGTFRAIYALGFRNPFRMKVQPGTGRILVNDVGQGTWEEINLLTKGKNYGWPGIEGKRTTQTMPANYQDPAYAYGRSSGCSITGGTFYNPTTASFPSQYVGKYFFADYCGGWIKYADPNNNYAVSNFATSVNRPLDMAVDGAGRVYYIARGGIGGGSDADNTSSNQGELWMISYNGNSSVSITVQPQSRTVGVGTSVSFVVSASGAAPLSYQWRRNGTNISGATSSTYTIASPTTGDNGARFSVVVSNATSSATSTEATLTVINNTVPSAQILTPIEGTLYSAGTSISYSGNATDTEDGTLPASAFTWRVDFHHDTHTHPAMDNVSGMKSGTFLISDEGETSDNVWYRLYLTVTDAAGGKTTVFRDIFPRKVQITLTTNPAGLPLKLDGSAVTTPFTFTGVVGLKRTIEASNTGTFAFSSWSHGGAAFQTIITPTANTTYTANFVPSSGTGVASGKYEIVARHSGKALEVRSASLDNGAIVQQLTYAGGANQQWNVLDLGGGEYKITAAHSGKALDIAARSTLDTAKVQQYTDNGGTNQKFRIESVGSGYYRIVAVHSSKCLDVAKISSADGAKIQQYTCNGGTNQQWSFISLGSAARDGSETSELEIENADKIGVFPNPSRKGSFTLMLPESDPVAVKIYDGKGSIVHEQSSKGGSKVVVDSKLKPGLYIIKVQGNKLKAAKKFMVD